MANSSCQGQCLCKSVTVTVEQRDDEVHACHCSMCRKWGGGPLLANDCGVNVSISGEENVTVFDSSPWAERGFCKLCGTHLFYRIKESGHHIMPSGLFDDSASSQLVEQIFIDEKPDYYEFGNQTRTLTAAEVFAKYAPPQ